jgi:hypothetical protein
MSRSAGWWIKSTAIRCEWAQKALPQLVQAPLATSPVQRRVTQTQQGCLRKHIGPMLGERPIGSVTAEVLNAFYAGLRRCWDHCDGQPQCQQPDPAGTPHAETTQAKSAANRDLVTLELVPLGASVRRMRTPANPDDLDALQQPMRDAARRASGDRSRIGEHERNARLAGSAETIATGVVAA